MIIMKKKYKALMLDLDGTTIPNEFYGKPSKKVKQAITMGRKKIHIGIATSRPYFHLNGLHDELKLSGPSIIHGGAQIMNFTTGRIYLEQRIAKEDMKRIFSIAKKMSLSLSVDEKDGGAPASKENTNHPQLGAIVFGIKSEKQADEFCDALAKLPEISTHKIVSWTKGYFDVGISHVEATKQYAILEVAKILGIETHEIIGVGDGYNDFPLLMACGLKVAIGNAVPELKAIADYIAPSVDEDGVADVIEKFIL